MLALAGSTDKRLDIYWCDVEGGAATLIVTPAGESILVDSGWPGDRDPARIAKIAKDVARLEKIDHYITTHFHTDHFGGIAPLAQLVPISNFYDHGFPTQPQRDIRPELADAYKGVAGSKVRTLKPGDTITLRQVSGSPSVELKVVAADGIVLGEAPGSEQIRACTADPKHEERPRDESDNARSIAFLLKFGDWQFFDAGDLTWNVEHKLVCPQNLIGTADVYQVTHHGMDTSNHPAVLRALKPVVAVMNNGPRKGGSASVVRLLLEQPSVQALFAVHRNVQATTADNASPELTANDSEQCAGEAVHLSVASDARSYSVSVPAKKTIRAFRTQ
jgi:beta-lactamase superfamily II metal-dependent hydrolase